MIMQKDVRNECAAQLCFARTECDRSDGRFPALGAWRTDYVDRSASRTLPPSFWMSVIETSRVPYFQSSRVTPMQLSGLFLATTARVLFPASGWSHSNFWRRPGTRPARFRPMAPPHLSPILPNEWPNSLHIRLCGDHRVIIMYARGSTGASVYATSVTQIEADSNQSTFAVLLCIPMGKRAWILSLRRKITWITFIISVVPDSTYL